MYKGRGTEGEDVSMTDEVEVASPSKSTSTEEYDRADGSSVGGSEGEDRCEGGEDANSFDPTFDRRLQTAESVGRAASDLLGALRLRTVVDGSCEGEVEASYLRVDGEDPLLILEEIAARGAALRDAWEMFSGGDDDEEAGVAIGDGGSGHIGKRKVKDDGGEGAAAAVASNFRALHMELITEAFGDDIDALRSGCPTSASSRSEGTVYERLEVTGEEEGKKTTEGGNVRIDVDVLAGCLRSGAEVFTEEERELLAADGATTTMTTTTPHERRRRAISFA